MRIPVGRNDVIHYCTDNTNEKTMILTKQCGIVFIVQLFIAQKLSCVASLHPSDYLI